MSTKEKGSDPILDQAIHEIRNEQIDPAVVSRAAERVWARVSEHADAKPAEVETIRSCADFQALIPAWQEGRLSPARALLLEDHTHECPACRKAVEASRSRKLVSIQAPTRRLAALWSSRAWAIAAGFILVAGATAFVMYTQFTAAPAGSRATVQSLDGVLYKVSANTTVEMGLNAPVEEAERIRTAKGSRAVIRLRDGSRVEMRERTDLSLTDRREGMTIRLAGGSIIVQAAKQRSRHLYVATEDCTVSVTGTVFSVNHGMKGSRVSVVEGEVRVTQGSETAVLHSGDQIATNASLAPVPVKEEIAWSGNFDNYLALLNEMTALRKKLEAVPGPGLRYSSRLLNLVPEGTVLYAAIPNIGPGLTEASRIFDQQLQQSEVLRKWWSEQHKSGDNQFDEMIAKVRAFSEYLGDEIVFAMTAGGADQFGAPLFLAEVRRSGLGEYIQTELGKLKGSGLKEIPRIADGSIVALGDPSEREGIYFYTSGNLAALSPDKAQLQRVAAGAGGFAKTPFGASIGSVYREGAAWLVCADLKSILSGKPAKRTEDFRRMVFNDVSYLIVQRKEVNGKTENRAVLTFADARQGIASWLAAPAPMRTLEFVSPDANLATSFVIKSPGQLVEELFGMMTASNPNFQKQLAEFEATTGVDVRADIARPLGGELTFAMDGPVLPVPSWKLAVEVYDPVRLQQSIEKLVASANREMEKSKVAVSPLRVDREQVSGSTFYAMRGIKAGFEAHYTFVDGYLIAAPSRELVVRAIQFRQTGYTLARSPKFTALLPRDGNPNFSGMVYHSLGSLVGPMAGIVKGGAVLTPEQRKSLDAVAAAATPTVVLVYGEQDRIQIASAGTFFGLNLEDMLIPGKLSRGARK